MNINHKQLFYEKYKEKIAPKTLEIENFRKSCLKNNDNLGYKNYLKTNYFRDLISCFEYIEDISINNEVHNNNFNGLKQGKINDIITGTYKNIKFNITEVSNAMVLAKKGVYCGPWDGVVLEIDFNKPILTFINISPRNDRGYMWGIWGGVLFCIISFVLAYILNNTSFLALYNLFFPERSFAPELWLVFAVSLLFTAWLLIMTLIKPYMGKINLEDVNFEKKYYVEAQDQVEARYILTTAFIDRLSNLQTVFCEKNTWISFNENKVTLSFETDKDLFELGNIHDSITNKGVLEQFYNEVTAITEIIDYFKLHYKIGL